MVNALNKTKGEKSSVLDVILAKWDYSMFARKGANYHMIGKTIAMFQIIRIRATKRGALATEE